MKRVRNFGTHGERRQPRITMEGLVIKRRDLLAAARQPDSFFQLTEPESALDVREPVIESKSVIS